MPLYFSPPTRRCPPSLRSRTGFRRATRKKRLRYFLRGAIMRWLWGRGSVGRAMRSQRIGQGFESPRLHHHKQTASQVRCRLLMAAKPAGERTCAQHFTCACLFALFSCIQASDLSVRAGSAACGARRFRPRRRPSGTTGLQIYIPRQTSALMAKLPSSRPAATPQSRCPSDFCVAGRGANLRATLYQATRFFTFPFWQPLRALHPCAQVRRLAEQDAFALPHHPGHVRHPSQTHPIFISLPLWRSSPRLHQFKPKTNSF